ncbi:hypothetical protein HMPREF3230_00712, partial [Gardnerella vaginalis]
GLYTNIYQIFYWKRICNLLDFVLVYMYILCFEMDIIKRFNVWLL